MVKKFCMPFNSCQT